MALDVNKLKNELLKLLDPNNAHFVGYPTTASDFATNWSNAYDTYAMDAQDVSTDPVLTANKNDMKVKLEALNIPVGVIATAASTFDDALKAYWLSSGSTPATFAILVVPTGTGACPNVGGDGLFSVEASSKATAWTAGILEASMASLLAIPSDDPIAKATALANALHAATTSALKVTISGSDTSAPTPQSITNTCTIS